MSINVPQKAQEGLKNSMADGVELPFPVCYFYTRNGNPQNKQLGGVAYHGGWAVDLAETDKIIGDTPSSFAPTSFVNREGKEYEVYTAYSLLVAPIAKRERWVDNRSHLQVLAMVGAVDGKGFAELGPHVLSAKGYQTKFLKEALGDWENLTQDARNDFAGGAEAKFFYASVGTDGKEPDFVTVGKAATSTVTPVKIIMPSAMGEKVLTTLYVGDEVAEAMADRAVQATEWLAEWDKKKDEVVETVEEFPLP